MKKFKLAAAMQLIGAVCFAIVAYANFMDGKIGLGVLALVATVCDVISAAIDLRRIRKEKERAEEAGETE